MLGTVLMTLLMLAFLVFEQSMIWVLFFTDKEMEAQIRIPKKNGME